MYVTVRAVSHFEFRQPSKGLGTIDERKDELALPTPVMMNKRTSTIT